MKRPLRLLMICVSLLLAACSGMPSSMNPRDSALTEYGAAIRWSEFDKAQQFLDPVVREQHPLTDLERERFKQIQITGYEVKSKQPSADGSVQQTVEIRLVNKNTQLERTITDRQTWRWDSENKHFWLTSGLPDFSAQ